MILCLDCGYHAMALILQRKKTSNKVQCLIDIHHYDNPSHPSVWRNAVGLSNILTTKCHKMYLRSEPSGAVLVLTV